MRRLIAARNTPQSQANEPEVKNVNQPNRPGLRIQRLRSSAAEFQPASQSTTQSATQNTSNQTQSATQNTSNQTNNLDVPSNVATTMQRINSRFPPTIEAKEGVNYNIESIGLVQPWDITLNIVKTITTYLSDNKVNSPYAFVNANGGLGLQSLAFLSSDAKEVLTYESNPKLRTFIKSNIDDARHRLVDDNRGFNGLPSRLAGWVVFFDTSFGERTGGRTPFEWLSIISNAVLVAILTPSIPQEVINPQYAQPQIIELKSGSYLSLYLSTAQSTKMVTTINRLTRKPMLYVLSSARDIEENQLFPVPSVAIASTDEFKTARNDTLKKKVTATYQHIPIPILILPPNMPPPSSDWKTSLINYLYWIMRPIVTAPIVESMICTSEDIKSGKCSLNASVLNVNNILDRLITDEKSWSTWQNAFTHYSFDHDNNYEVLEYLGDRYVGAVFTSLVNDKFPNLLTPGTATHFNHMYMSGKPHANYSIQMNLDKYVRTLVPIDFTTRKNLFESFMGALWQNAEALGSGYGFVLVKQLFAYMFAKFVPDSDLQYGSARNQVTDIFTRLEWGRVNVETKAVDNGSNATITLSFTALKMLASNNIAASPVIANITKATAKTAQADAWWAALAYLRSIGVTREFVNRLKYDIDFNNVEMKPYIDDLGAYARNKGLKGFYFEPAMKDENTGVFSIVLAAYQNNGRLIKLITGSANTSMNAKINAVKQLLYSV